MEGFLWAHHFDRSKNLKLSLNLHYSISLFSSSLPSSLPHSYFFPNSVQLTSSLHLSKFLHSSKSLSVPAPRHASRRCQKLPILSADQITCNPTEQASPRLQLPTPQLLQLLSCPVSQLSITFDPLTLTNYTLLPLSQSLPLVQLRFGDYSEDSNGLEK